MQAEAQKVHEATSSQGEAIPRRAGYGRFSTGMGRRSKAEFHEEFYARNAYVQSFNVAQHNLSTYQKYHIAHQRRRFA